MDKAKIVIVIIVAIIIIIIIYIAYQFLSGNTTISAAERVSGNINKWFGERHKEASDWLGNKGAWLQGKEIWKW